MCQAACSGDSLPIGSFVCSLGELVGSSVCIAPHQRADVLTVDKVAGSFQMVLSRAPSAVEAALRAGVAAALDVAGRDVETLRWWIAASPTGRRLTESLLQRRDLSSVVPAYVVSYEVVVPSDTTEHALMARAGTIALPGSAAQDAFVVTLAGGFGVFPRDMEQVVAPRTFRTEVVRTPTTSPTVTVPPGNVPVLMPEFVDEAIPTPTREEDNKAWIIVGIVCGALGALIVVAGVVYHYLFRRKVDAGGNQGGSTDKDSSEMVTDKNKGDYVLECQWEGGQQQESAHIAVEKKDIMEAAHANGFSVPQQHHDGPASVDAAADTFTAREEELLRDSDGTAADADESRSEQEASYKPFTDDDDDSPRLASSFAVPPVPDEVAEEASMSEEKRRPKPPATTQKSLLQGADWSIPPEATSQEVIGWTDRDAVLRVKSRERKTSPSPPAGGSDGHAVEAPWSRASSTVSKNDLEKAPTAAVSSAVMAFAQQEKQRAVAATSALAAFLQGGHVQAVAAVQQAMAGAQGSSSSSDGATPAANARDMGAMPRKSPRPSRRPVLPGNSPRGPGAHGATESTVPKIRESVQESPAPMRPPFDFAFQVSNTRSALAPAPFMPPPSMAPGGGEPSRGNDAV